MGSRKKQISTLDLVHAKRDFRADSSKEGWRKKGVADWG